MSSLTSSCGRVVVVVVVVALLVALPDMLVSE